MKNDKQYTDYSFWENYWNNENRKESSFYFDTLLDEHIRWDECTSYMEIGGAPGSVMAHMYKEHKLSVSTVDFTDKERIADYLKKADVKNYKIYQADFSSFNEKDHSKEYSVVASWGFVEHFHRDVCRLFIEKQKDMVSEGGYLVVELPNIRKLYWLMYWIFNRELIRIHNLKIMDIEWLKSVTLDGGDFELEFASYFFAMNEQNEFFMKHKRLAKTCRGLVDLFQKRNIPVAIKGWFYPYIVIIAKKRGM